MLRVADEVRQAIGEGRPVVALESTIIAHGMPHPRNVETAMALEATLRGHGVVPATIAVLDGALRVGLGASAIDRLASEADVAKVSLADLGPTIAGGGLGATTVAVTMLGAHRAGIRVFATGGIGGVHRGVETTGDISTDLSALGTIPVAVVSAGAKAILDLPRTLEALETRGVPVIGYRTDRFPAFYARDSGLPVEHRADTPAEVATMVDSHWSLGLATGALVANPIPAEAALDGDEIEAAIERGLDAAAADGVTGKALTPFLLRHVTEATAGRSLDANVALVLDNAALAAQVAVELSPSLGR